MQTRLELVQKSALANKAPSHMKNISPKMKASACEVAASIFYKLSAR
jgi:hypothetical protein